jgi:hypothetical protein
MDRATCPLSFDATRFLGRCDGPRRSRRASPEARCFSPGLSSRRVANWPHDPFPSRARLFDDESVGSVAASVDVEHRSRGMPRHGTCWATIGSTAKRVGSKGSRRGRQVWRRRFQQSRVGGALSRMPCTPIEVPGARRLAAAPATQVASSHAVPDTHCPRCGFVLNPRKPDDITRTWEMTRLDRLVLQVLIWLAVPAVFILSVSALVVGAIG